MSVTLNDDQRKYYRERLSHYLRSYRERNDLSQSEAAGKIGYAIDHYKRLELGIDQRMANTIEYLMNFASLDFGSVVDFLVYMENTAPAASGTRELYPWEKSLLSGFNELPSDVRRGFTSAYCAGTQKGPWSLQEGIDLLHKASSLGKDERTIIELLISRLHERAMTMEELESLRKQD